MILASSGTREGHMKGFTLIELLVVIAIIGVLSSVVLASLNTARNKGADTATRSNLAGARAQAEIFYDANNNSYDGGTAATRVCDAAGSATGGIKGIHSAVLAAGQASNASLTVSAEIVAPSTILASCNDTATAWAAQAPLKTGGTYCVDSTGAAVTNASASVLSGAGDTAC